VQGVDVSSVQGAGVSWSSVAKAGYKFAFIKVSEGSYYVDPYYAKDVAGAETAGMFAAPYVFAIPNYSGGALQADYALDHANYAPNGHLLPPILDIEYDPYGATGNGSDGTPGFCYGLTTTQMVSWINAFTAEIQRRTGQHPVIYTTANWWDTCTADSAAFTSTNPLWIASPASAPTLPAAWASWNYWQYGQSTVSGISIKTDVSYLNRTALELAAPGDQSYQAGNPASLQFNALDAGPAGTTSPPIAYSATGLPTGTQSATTGAVTGTLPATSAPFPVVVTASAQGDTPVTQQFSWYVHGTVALTNLASRTTTIGAPVRDQIGVQDGLSGCTLQFSATGLPPGLAISSCGMISGWPTRTGTFSAEVLAKDSSGATVAQGSVAWNVTAGIGRGPAGHLVLLRDGKCLTERSPTNIAIETCNSRATDERWTIAADGSIRIGGKCLAAKSASSTASAALDVTSCTGTQGWQLGSNAVLTYGANGKCLADTGSKNGSPAVAAVCKATSNSTGSASTPSTSQQWTLPAGPLTSDVARYCASTLHPAAGPSYAGTLAKCTTSRTQNWTIEPDGSLRAGGQCLRTVSGIASPGSLLHLGSCTSGAADQVWQLAGGPIGVQLVNPAAGLCVADPGDAASAGTALRIEPCVAGDIGTWWRVS
jgi:GH25 family lysozyme M1 (1,4-beta-N-acetylmuramidase)